MAISVIPSTYGQKSITVTSKAQAIIASQSISYPQANQRKFYREDERCLCETIQSISNRKLPVALENHKSYCPLRCML